MNDTVSKQSKESILIKLEELQELTGKKKEFQERLKKVEDEKGTVSEKIYTKVKSEYERDLRSIIVQLSPLEEEMNRAKEELKQEMNDIESKIEHLEEEISEAKFRRRVGEYSDDKLTQLTGPLDADLQEFLRKKEDKMDILTRLNSVGPAPAEDTTNEPGNGKAAEKGEFETILSRYTAHREEGEESPGNSASPPAQITPEIEADIDIILADKNDAAPADSGETIHNEIHDVLDSLADPSDESSGTPGSGSKSVEKDKTGETEAYPRICILSGTSSGKQIPVLPVTMSIGREHDNNIELKDSDVSRYHARILFRNGEYELEALDGSSGVWVNDKKCTNTVLQNEDKIRLGKTEMCFQCESLKQQKTNS